MKILVTGGLGFIGSNFILKLLQKENDFEIINVDAKLFGSNPHNLDDIKNSGRYEFVSGNITNKNLMNELVSKCDSVVNFAAETFVDRSIKDANPFLVSNIRGAFTLMDITTKQNKRFVQVSTDEVFGSLESTTATEDSKFNPSSPYAATKAAAEMLIRSYVRTYGVQAKITRCTNNFGPRQYPEKLIPKTIISAIKNQKIPLHGKGLAKRQWIHVFDHCDALYQIILKWPNALIYNISGNFETTNLGIVKKILKKMNKPKNLIKFVSDRPGQDRGYRVNANLIKKHTGFQPLLQPKKSLDSTIDWYLQNTKWWSNIPFEHVKNPIPWK